MAQGSEQSGSVEFTYKDILIVSFVTMLTAQLARYLFLPVVYAFHVPSVIDVLNHIYDFFIQYFVPAWAAWVLLGMKRPAAKTRIPFYILPLLLYALPLINSKICGWIGSFFMWLVKSSDVLTMIVPSSSGPVVNHLIPVLILLGLCLFDRGLLPESKTEVSTSFFIRPSVYYLLLILLTWIYGAYMTSPHYNTAFFGATNDPLFASADRLENMVDFTVLMALLLVFFIRYQAILPITRKKAWIGFALFLLGSLVLNQVMSLVGYSSSGYGPLAAMAGLFRYALQFARYLVEIGSLMYLLRFPAAPAGR